MCRSLRGGTYYGASLHITVGMLFLVGFFIDLLGIAEIWHNPYATYFSLILSFIYIGLFIIFGLLIFRGTEKESVRLLKGSLTGFITLQISAFVVYLVILSVTNSARNSRISAASLPPPVPSAPGRDLAEINAILKEASEEFRHNYSSNVNVGSIFSTAPPDVIDNPVFDDNQPIISIYQIVLLIAGVLVTFAYSTVVVMYVKEVSAAESERARFRS